MLDLKLFQARRLRQSTWFYVAEVSVDVRVAEMPGFRRPPT